MTDLIGSFRSLPPAQKVLVGGVAVVAALVLLAAVIFAAWALFRAVSRQS